MTSNFVFPPPPPPPPIINSLPDSSSFSSRGGRSNYGRGRGADRGRGQTPHGLRGGARGGYGNTWHAPGYARGASNSGYSYQQRNGFVNSSTPANYDVQRSQQYGQSNWSGHPSYGQNTSQSTAPNNTYMPHQGNAYIPQGHSGHLNQQFLPGTGAQPFDRAYQSPHHNAQAIAMGPPIRMGFKDNAGGAYVASPNQEFDTIPAKPAFDISQAHYKIDNRPQSSSRGRGQKRPHAEAFARPDVKPKPLTAPAVPSFGAPLATSTSPPKQGDPKPKKKPRKHNQLGLTPKGETPEISDDEDEEVKLAAALQATAGGVGASTCSFECEGKVFLLKSAQDIAAWIGERRKRYPTKQRITEAKAKAALKEEKERRKEDQRDKTKQAKERQMKGRHEKDAAKKKDTAEKSEKAQEQATVDKQLKAEDSQSTKARKKKGKQNGKKATEEADVLSQAEQLRKTLEETQRKLAELEERTKNMQKEAASAQAKGKKKKGERKGDASAEGKDQLAFSSPAQTHLNTKKSRPLSKDPNAPKPKSNPALRDTKSNPNHQAPPVEEEEDFDSDSISLPSTRPSDLELEAALNALDSSDSDSDSVSSSLSTRFTAFSPIHPHPRSNSTHSLSLVSLSSSSSSDSDSDSSASSTLSSSSGDAPSTHSLKPSKPIRVPPPPRRHPSKDQTKSPRNLCRNIIRRGNCRYQSTCTHRHHFLDDEEERVVMANRHAHQNRTSKGVGSSRRGKDGTRNRGSSRSRGRGRGDKKGRGSGRGKGKGREGSKRKEEREEGEGVDWEGRESLFQRLLRKQEEEEQEVERRKEREKEDVEGDD